MKKIISYITLSLIGNLFCACSYFTFNATICEQIASDPLATVPQECRIYNEDEAQKSFDDTQNKKMESNETIEFSQED